MSGGGEVTCEAVDVVVEEAGNGSPALSLEAVGGGSAGGASRSPIPPSSSLFSEIGGCTTLALL